MKVFLTGILFLGALAPAYGQLLSLGIKAGVPLNDALNAFSTNGASISPGTERWLIGPTAELHLPFRLSFEADALYRRQSYSVSSTSGSPIPSQWFNVTPTTTSFTNSLNNWQFPLLLKYDLVGGPLRPFVDVGVTFRHISGDGPVNDPNNTGFTIGGGLALKILFLRLSPEIRYTHFGVSNLFPPYVTGGENQTDFLVGFTF